jgi:5,10-methylenetetrahydromethanopterin reductase
MPIEFSVGYSARAVAAYPLERRQALVRLAEELGFDVLWHSNERFYRDLWVNMTMSAMLTSRIRLGTAIVEPYAVHPALTAVALATLDDVARGRAILGIGAGGSGFPALGVARQRPARAIREAIEMIRRFLGGERVDYAGELISFRGAQLHFKTRADIPIYVATRGKAVLQLAGEVADGVMMATHATPQGVAYAIGEVEKGLRRAGRRREDIRLMARVDCCVLPERQVARDGVKQMLAFMLFLSYPDRGFVEQAGLRVPDDLERLIARREYDLMHDAGRLIPEEFVDAFAWAGTAEDVAAQIARIVRLGVREIGCWVQVPPGYDIEPSVRAIAQEVWPRVEALVAGAAR